MIYSIVAILVAFGGISLGAADAAFATQHEASEQYVVYEPAQDSGIGKHVILLTGDEEYRSEEGLVQLAKILTFRHGFRTTVLFAIDPTDGTINPKVSNTLPGAELLSTADALVIGLRFRKYPDAIMKHFEAAIHRGIPIVAVRTSTHAFNFGKNSKSNFARYSHNSKEWPGGFGRQVLGETWAGHLGKNHKEATRAVPVESELSNPLLRGVGKVFAYSGAYEANPMDGSTILMFGEVLAGMEPDSPLEANGKNEPLQPVVWSRTHDNPDGTNNRVLCTTMGAATDLLDESFRRLLVNGVYWGLEIEVPEKANVRVVGKYEPTDYGFDGFRKGVKPSDLTFNAIEATQDE
ncbi:ThuA domain-containing protein [Adhaeretor mobilis]|nr:ThuA domain-containing protein [Adhaeretor mobilis]